MAGVHFSTARMSMEEGVRPTRRVVTGNDAQGRSRVVWDGPAPNAIGAPARPGGGMLELWVFDHSPAPLSGERDDGNLPYSFEPPQHGAHLRIVQAPPLPAGYVAPAEHEPQLRDDGQTWDRGGRLVHKTQTVDYGILLEGERTLVLDDGDRLMKPGDVVVQLGNWHGWSSTDRTGCRMAFVMMGADWEGTWPPAR
ncbi:MAG: cupin domain-containing protein [Chloroflexota bacterium]|nr:cupin domain-containing protein [Chloroflexota bacterium]